MSQKIIDLFSDLLETVTPTVAKAEEEEEEAVEEEEAEEEAPAEEEEEEEEEDDDDDDEDEVEDPLDKLREACAESSVCHPFKHHFEECVERVTKASQEEGYDELEYKEDCVEEFFHLQHCVNDCAAPKLFRLLK